MLADPYQADTDYRRLFENSEIFTSGFLKNWDTFASVIQSLPAMVALIEALSDNISAALANVSHLLPILVEASTGWRRGCTATSATSWFRGSEIC